MSGPTRKDLRAKYPRFRGQGRKHNAPWNKPRRGLKLTTVLRATAIAVAFAYILVSLNLKEIFQ